MTPSKFTIAANSTEALAVTAMPGANRRTVRWNDYDPAYRRLQKELKTTPDLG